ncbi:Putative NADPH-quinone reductase (modulator of drug activity B) [Glycomyces sambucus]|uniref:Putative NADPH-quinone reductase (Modulator of drug activity B) n=1 Tax=Glycomyces sambucus TaxID=380244 RepID=A0A1G9M6R7_9ACTN|nr:NAD(P)H oxidoreductase [Glycomyces sambucus]SDL69916.1 Putative NADPH-quinone reductase (modulator of drug activity B) [Glycomyces sambucus]
MTAPTALVVVAHHRADSLTAHVGDVAAARLKEAGYAIDLLDLRAEGFDPRMTEADQPDWDDRDKAYSPEVRAHMARLLAADVIVPVFPVYWNGVPALLKGWIDRVWNYGFGYGRSEPRLAGKRMLWLGLAGAGDGDEFAAWMQETLDRVLREGISFYCGIPDSAVAVLHDAEGESQTVDAEGNFSKGAPLTGDARAAHYAALDRRAEHHLEAFLGL